MKEETKEVVKPDYTRLYHDEARVLAHKIIDLMAEKKTDFVADVLEEDADALKSQEEANADFGIKVLSFFSESELPADYVTLSIDKIIDSLNGLSTFVKGSIASNEDEIVSRVYGKKNYQGKFRREMVTVGDIALKLNEIREQTGGNKSDFYDSEK